MQARENRQIILLRIKNKTVIKGKVKMFNNVTPEQAGISSEYVEKFIKALDSHGLAMHSVLMMRGSDIFAEYYWKPFNKEFNHRMYSQTKSFVGIAIGLLEEDGKLNLNDEVYKYFPEKIDAQLPEYLQKLTIKELLTMQTTGAPPYWFDETDKDRVHLYFNSNSADHPSGMYFNYDTDGAQVLSVLAEKLSGKSLFDFLNERIFKHLEAFKTASVLKVRNNDSFGDSGLLCTTRDMAAFARFVMNYGVWDGKRLMNEEFLKTATSKVVDNTYSGFNTSFTDGYGYLIWSTRHNGFAFNGMGAQLTVCLPEKDFIFTCTADNQGCQPAKDLIMSLLYEMIYVNLGNNALPANSESYNNCKALAQKLKLLSVSGKPTTVTADRINGRKFVCRNNRLGISEFTFCFKEDGTGEFQYVNLQGAKVIEFGICKNVFGKFPQYGYSDMHAGLPSEENYLYNCAASAAWGEESKLILKVQIIDKYFGNLTAVFSFKGNTAYVVLNKTAEDFLKEYEGAFIGEIYESR